MTGWRSITGELVPRAARAPFSMPEFRDHYSTIRRLLASTAVVATIAMGFAWGDRRELVIPALLGLAAAILVHDRLLRSSSWKSMAAFDSAAYIGMLVLIELPEAVAFVVMGHGLLGFLLITPRAALGLTAYLVVIGWLGYIGASLLDSQIYRPAERVLTVALASLMALFPTALAMLIAGAEMRAQRERVRQLLAEKDDLLAEKDRFVASISHELRTPLTVVHGLATLLESADLDNLERREIVRAVARESSDVAAIVEDLLVMARMEGGELAVRPQEFELAGLVHQIGRMAGVDPSAISSGPATVIADPLRVKQVVRNLVSNARRYGGPHIRVEISADDEEVTVAVCDDGSGVPAGAEDQIFEPYGRAHGSTTNADSVGLGLSVSRQLARMMGGDVVYRRSGSWTRFELTLPAEPAVTGRAERRAEAQLP